MEKIEVVKQELGEYMRLNHDIQYKTLLSLNSLGNQIMEFSNFMISRQKRIGELIDKFTSE